MKLKFKIQPFQTSAVESVLDCFAGQVNTLLICYHHGHEVGGYMSLERIVEQTKEDYYEALKASSSGWHEGKHDVMPWFTYLLSVWRRAYREFEERAERQRPKRGVRASTKNKSTIWLVLWSICCVASISTYPLICTGGCALHTNQNTAQSGVFIFFRDP